MREKPVSKKEVDRQLTKIKEGQDELNRIGQACLGYQKGLLQMKEVLKASQDLDVEIVKHLKMQMNMRKQQKPLA
ncbi:hypothetical protein [Paenibacillus prosopidis]|uniref:Spo0E like sporulation regulatory protein n=1 Tax=Paenibacillus prosopidis TaxID=630520 RepID=A0A368VP81_9BACL|nr:hypothetical protein [Paenibacillus prosopidis]RCW41620.1 hypothetical protein DFP97_12256 [Paenibacillus prosopidis]